MQDYLNQAEVIWPLLVSAAKALVVLILGWTLAGTPPHQCHPAD